MSKGEERFLMNISDLVILLMAIQASFWSDINVSLDLTNLLMSITSWVCNFSLYFGHFFLLEPEGKMCLKDCAFGLEFGWYQLEQTSWECNCCLCSDLTNAPRNALCQQLMHWKSCMDFFSHKRITLTSSGGAPSDSYVLQTSTVLAVGRGWWLVLFRKELLGFGCSTANTIPWIPTVPLHGLKAI